MNSTSHKTIVFETIRSHEGFKATLLYACCLCAFAPLREPSLNGFVHKSDQCKNANHYTEPYIGYAELIHFKNA